MDLVTTALLIMIRLEKKNFSWENAKKMMAKVDAFKEQLEEYRGEDVPEVSSSVRAETGAINLVHKDGDVYLKLNRLNQTRKSQLT